jgi:hypothetical protein
MVQSWKYPGVFATEIRTEFLQNINPEHWILTACFVIRVEITIFTEELATMADRTEFCVPGPVL